MVKKSGICIKCNKFHKRIESKGLCRPCFRKQRRLESPLIKCQCDPDCPIMIHSIGHNGEFVKYAHAHASKLQPKGSDSYNWKGGIVWDKHTEEFLLYKPYHPYCDSRGYVVQYRVIKEIYLSIKYGYPVYIHPNLIVHHINHVRLDNRPENLQIMTKGEHSIVHRLGVRGKKYKKSIV